MNELELYAKKMTRSISDPIERKEAYDEIYNHLLESYDAFRKTSTTDEEALQLTIEHFGEMDVMKSELKEAHIKRMNKKSLLIIFSSTLLVLVVLFGLLIMIFN